MESTKTNTGLGARIEQEIAGDVLDRLKAQTGSITVLPEIAFQALEMVKDPESSVATFADLIQQDIKLATDILTIANSVIYSPGLPTASLSDAIVRLGFVQCKNVIISSSINSTMNRLELDDEWIKEVLSRHGVLTGVLATNLNRRFGCGFAGEEFAAGLIHDFGRLLMAATFKQDFKKFDELSFDESPAQLLIEQQLVGCNHCQVGAWFAHEKGLPHVLSEVIRYHHQPELAKECPRLTMLVAVADHMANYHQREQESSLYDPADNPFIGMLEESGVPNAVLLFERTACKLLEQSVQEAYEFMSI